MKSLKNSTLIILVAAFVISSCKSDKNASKTDDTPKDTLATASGLKYYYTAKGEGRKVEPGSKVTAILSLQVNDSVIWTSYADKDSSFTYIADRGGVIKGYNEMAMLLREGDDVVAIMPSEIAYGERGSGDVIPPNTTLVYNQFKITKVSEPRLLLADTLFYTLKNKGIDALKTVYKQVTTTQDSVLYHGGMSQLSSFWGQLNRAKLYEEAFEAFSFISKDSEDTTLQFYVINALERQGKLKEAIAKIDGVLKNDLPANQKEYFLRYRQELSDKLKK